MKGTFHILAILKKFRIKNNGTSVKYRGFKKNKISHLIKQQRH